MTNQSHDFNPKEHVFGYWRQNWMQKNPQTTAATEGGFSDGLATQGRKHNILWCPGFVSIKVFIFKFMLACPIDYETLKIGECV